MVLRASARQDSGDGLMGTIALSARSDAAQRLKWESKTLTRLALPWQTDCVGSDHTNLVMTTAKSTSSSNLRQRSHTEMAPRSCELPLRGGLRSFNALTRSNEVQGKGNR